MLGVNPNWCALALAIASPIETYPEAALAEIVEGDRLEAQRLNSVALREVGYSYRSIAKMYGVSDSAIWRRVKTWEARRNGTDIQLPVERGEQTAD